MGRFYKAYWDGWEQGEPQALNVPWGEDWPTDRSISAATQTVISATADYGMYFDQTYWYFTRDTSYAQRLRNQGFTNVYGGEYFNKSLYISPTHYFRFNYNGARVVTEFWDTDGRIATIEGQSPQIPCVPGKIYRLNNGDDTFQSVVLSNVGELTFDLIVWHSLTGSASNSFYNRMIVFWDGAEPIITPSDPYAEGGESDAGGGTGNFDGTSVDVDFTTLPTLSAVDTGFITLYNPTLAQLQSLASYMWSGLFDLDTFKKLFADPMQAILGLSIVPGPVPGGATQNVRIGNIDSGVSMTKAATQYIDIDCGTLNVEEFWGAYLDYEPYTKAEIFLPFIGVHQIAIDDIMNKSVHIKYHIDLLSGGCACEIKCGGSVLYTFIGSCAVSIPVTGSDWTNLINGVLSAASAIGTMVATGGAAAPAAASTIASAAVNSLKPSIEKSGSIAGAGGLLAGKVPVLILTRPRQALPGKQNTFTGYPAFITRSLGALTGYTEVHSIRLSGIDGTESEIDEIEELLKGGVIL